MALTRARGSRSALPCLFLALVLVLAGRPLRAQADSSAQGPKPQKDSRELVGIGWAIDPIEPTRWQFDLLLSDVELGERYTLATGARIGQYAPDELVGARRAALDGFAPDARKLLISFYMGLQGRAPLLPRPWGLYARVAAGGSAYMGQQFRDAPPGGHPSQIQRMVPTRLAPGIEAAVGAAWLPVSGEFGLRAELRLGYEHIPRSDRQTLNSRLVFGFAFPR
jgi:hypothetical protein